MPDSKISGLPTLATPAGADLLLVIDNVSVNAVGKKITLDSFFSQISSNTIMSGTLMVDNNVSLTGSNTYLTSNLNVLGTSNLGVLETSSNGVTIRNSLTPANSSITVKKGKIFYDTNYIYVAVANNTVKRIALSSF